MKITNLLIVTQNLGKAEELKKLLAVDNIVIDCKNLPLLEIQSLDIKKIGHCKTVSALYRRHEIRGYDAILTDDTSLTCWSLNGLPGPLIKWFLKTIGTEGLLSLVRNKKKMTVATCLLTLGMVRDRSIYQFEGNVSGKLVEAKGKSGFGWDSIFQPEGYQVTYGEMDSTTKNRISHRALAAERLREWLKKKLNISIDSVYSPEVS